MEFFLYTLIVLFVLFVFTIYMNFDKIKKILFKKEEKTIKINKKDKVLTKRQRLGSPRQNK